MCIRDRRYIRKDGSYVWANLTTTPVRTPSGELAYFGAITEDISDRKQAELGREAALARIKKLEGVIPICMHCKKIRDDKDSWNQLEKYISDHSEALFSHGICPECVRKHYPEE